MNQKRTFIFASGWQFLPEGIKKIEDEFRTLMRTKRLVGDVLYRQFNHTFLVECPMLSYEDSVEVQKMFLKIWRGLIQEETSTAEDADDTESDNEDNTESEIKPKSRLIRSIEFEEERATTESQPAVYPEEIRSLAFQYIWICENEHSLMDAILPVQDQLRIESLTGVKLVRDLNLQSIFIGAQSEDTLQQAIRKLDNTRKYFFLRSPIVFHMFYCEEHKDFQITMKPLLDVKKRLIETTLIDPIRRPGGDEVNVSKLLSKSTTARCCLMNVYNRSYELRSGKKLNPVTKEINIGMSMKLWAGYKYPPRGDESLDLMKNQPVEVEEEDIDGPRGPEMPHVDKIERFKNWQRDLPPAVEHLTQMLIDSAHRPSRAMSGNSYAGYKDGQATPLDSRSGGQKDLRAEDSISRSGSRQTLSISGVKDLRFDGPNDFLNFPPLKPAKSSSSSQRDRENSFRPGIHTDAEVDTRKFHNTMRQQAPRNPISMDNKGLELAQSRMVPASPDLQRIDPTHDLIKELRPKVETFLAAMRGWEGELSLEAQFGRSLAVGLPSQYVARGDYQNSFDPEWAAEEILRKNKTIFTRILTTAAGDIEHLIHNKDERGRNLWKTDAEKWSVVYEIECLDQEKNVPFFVKIDAENFGTHVKSLPQSMGKVFVHCTLRNWDFCIVAEGVKDLAMAYGAVAKDIVETLYIPDGKERITSMDFQIPHRHNVEVTSIRIRRNTHYISLDSASILNITEVNDLFINGQNTEAPYDPGRRALYHGFTNDKNTIHPGPMWFEVGVMSVVANELFQDNQQLEFGDEVGWTIDTMTSKNVSSVIFGRACEVVKQMDGVGYWNEKCSGIQLTQPQTVVQSGLSREESKQRQKSKPTPQQDGFW